MEGGSGNPKKGKSVLCQSSQVKYEFIRRNAYVFKVSTMSEMLEVSRSKYYQWLHNPITERKKKDEILESKIQIIHNKSNKRYGSPRIHSALKDEGERVSRKRVARIMRENKIVSISKKRFKATTNSKHSFPVCSNLLNQNFHSQAPNQAWVGDITYIPTAEGWVYLATVIDLFSRMVVGWAVRERMTTDLVEKAFLNAYWKRKPSNGLIFHSDRGSQYASHRYQKLLKTLQVNQSMSAKGNCYDNAVAESFFGKLKTEFVSHEKFSSRKEAKSGIFDYVEIYFNRERKHSTLNYLSPLQFEEYHYISIKLVS
ncbi:MAG: IS3 family transposase [Limnothrix sp. RL_2_0]|nr:IS3 family transposase [Limnothrix sp. RL_2_0]